MNHLQPEDFMNYNRQLFSAALGNASMVFWMIAQVPQLYQNHQQGTAKALSKLFLSIWLLGDLTNLIGSILTDQQPFQIRLATYFLTIDIIMLMQYGHLHYNKQPRKEPLLRGSSTLIIPIIASALASPVSARKILISASQFSEYYQLGMILSWICAILYLTSRIPQILLNYNNKSVKGLSISMFACAFMGNLTYAISLITSDDAFEGDREFWIRSLPFLVGSVGTLLQDGIIFCQSRWYQRFENDASEVDV